jgi:hypothetical protein
LELPNSVIRTIPTNTTTNPAILETTTRSVRLSRNFLGLRVIFACGRGSFLTGDYGSPTDIVVLAGFAGWETEMFTETGAEIGSRSETRPVGHFSCCNFFLLEQFQGFLKSHLTDKLGDGLSGQGTDFPEQAGMAYAHLPIPADIQPNDENAFVLGMDCSRGLENLVWQIISNSG